MQSSWVSCASLMSFAPPLSIILDASSGRRNPQTAIILFSDIVFHYDTWS
jgi:hypothetical protein